MQVAGLGTLFSDTLSLPPPPHGGGGAFRIEVWRGGLYAELELPKLKGRPVNSRVE